MLGIYVHIPFCKRKCPYCDFYSAAGSEEDIDDYVNAVCRNIAEFKNEKLSADTLYFGGGTPSLLTAEQAERIIKSVKDNFKTENAEVTLEANPSSVNFGKLKDYVQAGVNRISFGIQSADNSELGFLGRLHDFETARQAVENAAKAGFYNISADIMLGLKGQTPESLQRSLEKFIDMPIDHISAYMLKIEAGTAFDCDSIRTAVADEDEVSDMYLQTVSFLESNGFEQYEISNFAKDKKYSKHNLKYWQGEEYLGFGSGAHSFYKGERFFCPKDLKGFTKDIVQKKTVLEDKVNELEEYIMLGLRLKNGVNLERIEELSDKTFVENFRSRAEFYEKNRLCEICGGNVRLTAKGFLLSNAIIGDLID